MAEKKKKGFWDKDSAAREWIESIVIAFVLAMFIRAFFIQAFKIPSGSMRKTLIEGDRLMVNKLRYGPLIPWTEKRIKGYSSPQRGDVVVFIYPEDPKRDFIKRIVAFGGEKISIRDGDIYIDGELIDEEPLSKFHYYRKGSFVIGDYKVPEDHVFVLGDNSASSHDSRFWGPVPVKNIIGRAEVIYWPFNRWGLLY